MLHSLGMKRIQTKTRRPCERAPKRPDRSSNKGKRIFMQIQEGELLEDSLTGYQNRLCESFNDNSLNRQMIAANKAYGHGQGAERPDFVLRQHLEPEYTTRALRDNFRKVGLPTEGTPKSGQPAYGRNAEVRAAWLRKKHRGKPAYRRNAEVRTACCA